MMALLFYYFIFVDKKVNILQYSLRGRQNTLLLFLYLKINSSLVSQKVGPKFVLANAKYYDTKSQRSVFCFFHSCFIKSELFRGIFISSENRL